MTRPLALAALLALLAGGPALAHARLIRAVPRVGATVRPAPSELVLQFSEKLDLKASSVTLTGPGGRVATGPLTVDAANPHLFHAAIRGAMPAGSYRVQWIATAADSHRMDGDFSFRVAPQR